MSPASQGALEVERYIGSCLISSNVRQGTVVGSGQHKPIIGKKQQEQPTRGKVVPPRGGSGCYAGQNYASIANDQQCQVPYGTGSGWTGAPLISMTSSPRRCNQRSSPSLGQQQQQQQQQLQQSSQQTTQPQQQQQQQQQQQSCEQQVPGHLHKSPLSRLAIHTHGAPLILAGRFHNRAKLHNPSNGVANPVCNGNSTTGSYVHAGGNVSTSNVNVANGAASRCPPSRAQRPAIEPAKKPQASPKSDCPSAATGKETVGTNISNIDSLSIASDESSGSNNSENSLPRIIKPRKRRKKERKPPNNIATPVDVAKHPDEQQFQQSQNQQQQQQLQNLQQSPPQQQHQQQQQQLNMAQNVSSEHSSIVTLKPYAPSCYEQQQQQQQQQQRYEAAAPPHLRSHRRPPMTREGLYGCRLQSGTGSSIQELADVRQRYAHRHVQVKVLDDNRNVVMPAPMRAMPHPKAYRHVAGHHHHHHHHHHSATAGNVPRYMQQQEYEHPAGCEDIRECLGTCQCRYCDPSGLIWDVDQNGYSPFLTPPPSDYCHGQYGQVPPIFLSRPSLTCQQEHQHQVHQQQVHQQQQQQAVERLFDVDNSRLRHDRESCASSGSGVILRRSWSDPTSYFSDEITAPSKDVGVIGDRGGQPSDNGKRRTLWRGDTLGAPTSMLGSSNGSVNGGGGSGGGGGVGGVSPPSPKGLEVSTEIVTSPNGHRDLEIKFYSSPSAPLNPLEEDKSFFTDELVDDADEDFSDLWSYHESKLQQDFRTLLQAEE